jgi:hypothetical protein
VKSEGGEGGIEKAEELSDGGNGEKALVEGEKEKGQGAEENKEEVVLRFPGGLSFSDIQRSLEEKGYERRWFEMRAPLRQVVNR